MSSTQNGYLFIADITGYTVYLNESELEHAHHVLKTLLELLVAYTRPPLIIDRVAGDAVISYGLQDNFLSGQTFLELIEDSYVAFRKTIELMVLNNTCHCNACANIANLDLKFFVHHGSFALQRLDKHDELLGPDVIIIHRLLKNHVMEETGIQPDALYTDVAIKLLGIEDVTFALEAWGDFDGRGIWTFTQDGDIVDIRYDWVITAEKALLRRLSFLLKPIFAANHRWAMAQGEKSLKLELPRRRGGSEAELAAIPPPGPTFKFLIGPVADVVSRKAAHLPE